MALNNGLTHTRRIADDERFVTAHAEAARSVAPSNVRAREFNELPPSRPLLPNGIAVAFVSTGWKGAAAKRDRFYEYSNGFRDGDDRSDRLSRRVLRLFSSTTEII